MNRRGLTYSSHLKPAVTLSGAAKEGRRKPPVDPVVVSIHESAYLFKVELPGVKSEIGNLRCDMNADGKVRVHGMVSSGEVRKESSTVVINKRLRRFSAPATFTICFALPGRVDPRLAAPKVHPEGILEVIVIRANVAGRYLRPA